MPPSLLLLHGMTLNSAVMRRQLGRLRSRLERRLKLVIPDAPHVCDEAMLDRLYRQWNVDRPPPPHCYWWNANADGSVYDGWEETRALVEGLMKQHETVGVLGFSQGAAVAATVAALAAHGQLPAIRFAVLIAGAPPRAENLKPYFTRSMELPSLHVWGRADSLVGNRSELLASRFAPEGRELLVWDGGHALPTAPRESDAIMAFVERQLAGR